MNFRPSYMFHNLANLPGKCMRCAFSENNKWCAQYNKYCLTAIKSCKVNFYKKKKTKERN